MASRIGRSLRCPTVRNETDCNLRAFRSRTKARHRLRVVRVHGSCFRFAQHKRHCVVLRNGATDRTDHVSTVRTSLALTLELTSAASRMLTKSADVSCRSRQRFCATSAKVCADFFYNGTQPTALVEIFINLAVPRSSITLPNELSEFGQFLRRKLINCAFDFGQAHVGKTQLPLCRLDGDGLARGSLLLLWRVFSCDLPDLSGYRNRLERIRCGQLLQKLLNLCGFLVFDNHINLSLARLT